MKTLIASVMSFKFLAVAAAMGALPLMATEYTWKGAATGGSWNTASNWTTDGSTDAATIPTGDDTAIIPATYTSGVSLKMEAQWASVSNLVLNADLTIDSSSHSDLRLAITVITNTATDGVGGKFIMAKDNMKLMPRAMKGAPNHYKSYWYQPIVAKSSNAKISLTQHTSAGNGGACTAYLYGPIEGSGQLTIYTEWNYDGTLYMYGDNSAFEGTLKFGGVQNRLKLHVMTENAGVPKGTVIFSDGSNNYNFEFGEKEIAFGAWATNTTSTVTLNPSTSVAQTIAVGSDTLGNSAMGALNVNSASYASIHKVGSSTVESAAYNYKDLILEKGVYALTGTSSCYPSGSTIFKGGILRFDAQPSAAVALTVENATSNMVFNTMGNSVTLSNAIGSNNSSYPVTKKGAGTLMLGAVQSTACNLKVEEGTLVVTPGSTFGDIEISENAYLGVNWNDSWGQDDVITLFSITGTHPTLTSSNFKMPGITTGNGYTLSTETSGNTTTYKAAITHADLVWKGTSGANWTDSGVWNGYTYASGDKVIFNDDSFGYETEMTVNIPSDIAPGAITFEHTTGHTLYLTGEGAITLASFDKTGTGTVSLGNGKNNFGGTLTVSEGTLALGTDQPLDSETYTLHLGTGAVLDLAGHKLNIGTSTRPEGAGDGYAVVTNSVQGTLAIFTAGCGGDSVAANANYFYNYGGYLQYVTTGKNDVRFYYGGDNYHTGGTVLSNVTMRIASPKQFGTGPITLFNGSFEVSSNQPDPRDWTSWSQDVYVYGNSRIYIGPNSTQYASFKGSLYGDGVLTLQQGWKAYIRYEGDMSNFKGTVIGTYNCTDSLSPLADASKCFYISQDAHGVPEGRVLLANVSGLNRLFVQGIANTPDKYFGMIETEAQSEPTNAYIVAHNDTVNFKVGATGMSGVYAGSFYEWNSSTTISVEKLGEGTWTLLGTNNYFKSTFTVSGGKVVFANPVATKFGSKVVVGNGGTIAGTGTIDSPVEFKSGAILEQAADGTGTLKFTGSVDASTLTVKLTGTLDPKTIYPLLVAGTGSTGSATVATDVEWTKGTWRTSWVDNGDGTKTLTGYFHPAGLMIIIR